MTVKNNKPKLAPMPITLQMRDWLNEKSTREMISKNEIIRGLIRAAMSTDNGSKK